jgi:hypothetical protein
MSKRSTIGRWSLGLLGVLALTALPLVGVADDNLEEGAQEQLEARLPLGETRDFYRGLLTGLGYTIVAIHEPAPDAAEYEVSKENRTAIIQIDMNGETRRAIEIAVITATPGVHVIARAPDLSERTELLSDPSTSPAEDSAPNEVIEEPYNMGERGSCFSDRDQARAAQLVREMETLPMGYGRHFYQSTLVSRGYQLSESQLETEEELAFEAEKDGQTLAVHIRFDLQTGDSVAIRAFPLWQEAGGTHLVQHQASSPAAEQTTESVGLWPADQGKPAVALSPGETQTGQSQSEDLTQSHSCHSAETQAEEREQPSANQLGMSEEPADTAEETVTSAPVEPNSAEPTEDRDDTEATPSPSHYNFPLDVRVPARGSQFSDRDQQRAAQLMREVETLPVGHEPKFYQHALAHQGYQISERESNTEEELAFEAGKDGQTLAVRVRFDVQTGESLTIEAIPLWREALDTDQKRLVSMAETESEVRSDGNTIEMKLDTQAEQDEALSD